MHLGEILPRALARNADTTAVICGTVRLSYRELAARIGRVAAGFATLGIRPGERIAILHRNCHRVLEVYFAALQAGAVLVPLNHRLSAADLAYILDDTGCRLLIADDGWSELAGAAIGAARGCCELIWSSMTGFRHTGRDYENFLAEGGPEASGVPVEAGADDAVNIYYTSGTTGHHKGVVLTHRNIRSHALGTIADLHLRASDTWGHFAPMFHLADAWAVWAMTWVGGCHVMTGSFAAEAALRAMAEHGVTVTNLVPTMLNDLLANPLVREIELPHLRLLMSGGAPISPAQVRRITACFDAEYVQTYGLTETSPFLTFSLLNRRLRAQPSEEQLRYRSMTGRAARGVELRVVDEQGRDVPADGLSVGEILARGERVTPGYWRLPEASAEAWRGGWFHTGDLATIDAEGFVNIVDRKKDVILSGGELVYSTEVENALYQHPAVREAAVIGIPDQRLGERVHAVVALRAGAEVPPEELRAHCRQRLAGFKCPRSFGFIEALPRTGSGKIAKGELRDSACD